MNKIILVILLCTLALTLPLSPTKRAFSTGVGGELPFGGVQGFTLICTCSANTLHYIFDYRVKSVLPLVYQPGVSKLYAKWNIWGRYFLGSYRPGVRSCLIFVGEGCITIQSAGMMGSFPGTGTSGL